MSPHDLLPVALCQRITARGPSGSASWTLLLPTDLHSHSTHNHTRAHIDIKSKEKSESITTNMEGTPKEHGTPGPGSDKQSTTGYVFLPSTVFSLMARLQNLSVYSCSPLPISLDSGSVQESYLQKCLYTQIKRMLEGNSRARSSRKF